MVLWNGLKQLVQNNNILPLITPIPEQNKDAEKLVTPIVEKDKNEGIYVTQRQTGVFHQDRAGNSFHGGSAWKLIDKKGNQVATLDKNGNVLRQ